MHWLQGFILTAALSWVAAKYLGPFRLMDVPQGRRQLRTPIPLTGGLALFVATLVGLGLGWLTVPFTWPQYFGILGLGVLGYFDDCFNLPAHWKALVGLTLALVVAYPASALLAASAATLPLLGIQLPHSQLLYFGLLALMYWSIPPAFNRIDGGNGLAIGYGIIILLVLAWHGTPHPYLLGTLLALLTFNWPRARHLLGTCGSMSLGLILALLAVNAFGSQNPNALLWLFAYPILDGSMRVAIRLSRGQSPGLGSRSPLHLQWQDRLPALERVVVPFLWLNAGACAMGAVASGWLRIFPWLGLASFGAQALVFWTLARLEHQRVREPHKPAQKFRPSRRPSSQPQEAS